MLWIPRDVPHTSANLASGALLASATSYLGGIAPLHYWDFINNRAVFNSLDVGAVTDTPGWAVTGGSLVMNSNGLLVTNQTVQVSGLSLTYPMTLWVEIYRTTDTAANEVYFQTRQSGTERAALSINTSDSAQLLVNAGGSAVATINPVVAISLNTAYKMAGRVELNNFNLGYGGNAGVGDTSGAAPTTATAVQFGSNNGASFAGNYIRRAAIFNSALSNANLQTVTT